jgi:hypothetical protein
MENLKMFLSQVTDKQQQQEQQQQQPLVFEYPLTTHPWSFWRDPCVMGETNSQFGDFFIRTSRMHRRLPIIVPADRAMS